MKDTKLYEQIPGMQRLWSNLYMSLPSLGISRVIKGRCEEQVFVGSCPPP